jgi:hypothetical protein
MRKPVWDVVATVDEPAPLVLAFAAHTLSLGPRCVHIYLDQPNAVVQAALAGVDRVQLTVCTPEYWAKSARRMRPPLHVGRQKENARQVYETTPAEWMVSIDCDEFLSSGADLQADLADQGDDVTFMRIAVRERVMLADAVQGHIFDGIFRKPIPNFKQDGWPIYGVFADFLRHGMTGHAIGKSAFRTGRGLAMCLHAPLKAPIGVTGARSFLRHFDGLTPLHYALKLLRRTHEPKMKGKPRHGAPRLMQMQTMAEVARDAYSIKDMVDYLKTLRPDQVQALRALDALDETGFDPSPAMAAMGLTADVSVAAFDTELRARDAGLLAASGLVM